MRRAEATLEGTGARGRVTQAEIVRAIKAAQAAGLTVFEFSTTKQGVRVITAENNKTSAAMNPWDEVLNDGPAK